MKLKISNKSCAVFWLSIFYIQGYPVFLPSSQKAACFSPPATVYNRIHYWSSVWDVTWLKSQASKQLASHLHWRSSCKLQCSIGFKWNCRQKRFLCTVIIARAYESQCKHKGSRAELPIKSRPCSASLQCQQSQLLQLMIGDIFGCTNFDLTETQANWNRR